MSSNLGNSPAPLQIHCCVLCSTVKNTHFAQVLTSENVSHIRVVSRKISRNFHHTFLKISTEKFPEISSNISGNVWNLKNFLSLHHFPGSKSVTSWRGQKSVVSVEPWPWSYSMQKSAAASQVNAKHLTANTVQFSCTCTSII